MITFEDLERVNKEIQTIDVKDRPYAQVSQRIKAFRKLFPMGFICTEIISNKDGVCIIEASAGYVDENGDKQILGSGIAYEKENSTFINKTSYIENCETSAVGRALGMIGLGIDTDVASAEEVQNANIQQEAAKPITAEKRKALLKMLDEEKIPTKYICELYSVEDIKELSEAKFVNLVNNWEKLKKKYHERNNS